MMAHSDAHGTPDAVFPNNWFSTHRDARGGATVLYPMKAPNRQAERRADIIAMLQHGKSYYSRHLSYAAVRLPHPRTATQKLRIVTRRVGTGRQKLPLERWTHPTLSQRACICENGLQSCRGKSAARRETAA
jgi:hypothetical protein